MKNIGIKTNVPKKKCEDKNCPHHGSLRVKGNIITGTVVSDKMHKSITVKWGRKILIPKYERYEKRITKIKAHNPTCINAKEGDIVRIMLCKPLSKTKNYVVIDILGKEKGYIERKEALEESKFKEKPLIKKEEGEKEENASAKSKDQ